MTMEIIPGPNLTVPTAPSGDSSNKPASTEFVASAIATLTVPTAPSGDSSNKPASTEFVASAIATAFTVIGFSAHKGGVDQTDIPDASFTTVTWPTEVYDVGNYFASNAWVPPAGKVSLTAAVLVGGTIAAGALTAVAIYKNGANYKQGNWPSISGAGTGLITMEDNANGTDSYTVSLYVDLTVGTGTIPGDSRNTYFMGHWLGS